jgi:hypothetical protein
MRRYERAKFLERLCELRRLYTLRGHDDRASEMTIEEAVQLISGAFDAEAGQALPSQRPA